ncbi:MAG: YciI family protein [Pseudomonadota bacterium]
MKKFLVLYRSTISATERMSKSTPEQGKAVMDAWMGWAQRSAAALVEMGAPLGDSTLLKGSATAGYIGGFSIVQAESVDAAKKIFDGHPHFEAPGNSIELLELLSMPGT